MGRASHPLPPPQATAATRLHYFNCAAGRGERSGRAHRARPATSRHTRCAWSTTPRRPTQDPFAVDRGARRLRSAARRGRVLLQGRVRPRFRLRAAPPDCPPDLPAPPPINYLAKDYGSFRTILLDRLNQLLPDWAGNERSRHGRRARRADRLCRRPAQLSAGRGRYGSLSATARSRISLRRHALLVDYRSTTAATRAPGCRLQAQRRCPSRPDRDALLHLRAGHAASLAVGAGTKRPRSIAGVVVFEPMQDAHSSPSTTRCSSTPGATPIAACRKARRRRRCSAVIPNLQAGDVLIFQEVLGPQTGDAGRCGHPPSLRGAAYGGRHARTARAIRSSIRSSRRAPALRSPRPRSRRRR